jgi:predicted amidohydrolase
MRKAAAAGANWVVTPELAVSGYTFAKELGTEWIAAQPDSWMDEIRRLAARHRLTVFLATPERDARSGKLHNTIFVIADDGRVVGSHRKINTLPTGSEAWSTPGYTAAPIVVPPSRCVGLLICSDAYSPPIAAKLRDGGADLLVSAAAWAPGLHGPDGEWERVTRDTGLPLIVCNRTGRDGTMDFTAATTVIAEGGRRLLSLSSEDSKIFVVDWDLRKNTLASRAYQELAV